MDFAELSNDAQIERLTRVARAALPAWGMAGAGVEPIKYRENAVFRIDAADGGRYVMRIHRPGYRTDDHIRSEMAWMQALSSSGIVTPRPLATRSGDLLAVADAAGVPEPRQCDLLSWVDGQPLGSLEGGVDLDEDGLRRTYRTIGETAARLHLHGREWNPPAGFVRRPWDTDALLGEQPTFGKFWELDLLTGEQRTLLFQARDRARVDLHAFGQDGGRYGLVHGDLVPDNILVGPTGLRVVDFDDCGESWYGFELATSVFPLFGSPAFEPARDGYVEGYRSLRPLPDADLAMMPAFLMARGLSYLGWPVGRHEMQSGRDIAPLLAMLITELAERYLNDQLG